MVDSPRPFIPFLSDIFQYNSFTYAKFIEVVVFLQVPVKALYVFPLSIRVTYPTHLILLNLIFRTVFGEQYKS